MLWCHQIKTGNIFIESNPILPPSARIRPWRLTFSAPSSYPVIPGNIAENNKGINHSIATIWVEVKPPATFAKIHQVFKDDSTGFSEIAKIEWFQRRRMYLKVRVGVVCRCCVSVVGTIFRLSVCALRCAAIRRRVFYWDALGKANIYNLYILYGSEPSVLYIQTVVSTQ